ncbi:MULTISPECIES: aminotransferase-like domain-containing protein [Mucilaginibacter]|jgi:GntR family transcriptional regulator/MocR family aminotransferase|uniref:aminotransferase-like domain-containing protein n=1 Tax=Mucilaginibacter TaxID=423349 RepID=UPI0008711D76|nr:MULTISPECIES: PLP-dependent aminotransferase family protein [Mucilaginibacter]NVM67666.1 GntR family transcriptional regulator/MocR family aminotransferase [Mucilaginibacter sp. SG538B]GGA96737.1 GntR family transcriptional regulator [Mucilaginibacter rubeus]SCW49356.1 GntR family transcriptional regulator / MocR family aminotransferase [Mucilaginibacter sp. NFR10]
MLPYHNLIVIDKQNQLPVYRQITNRLISLIREGLIPPGTFFPGTRQMAEFITVNRKTIINAYEELMTEDWIESVDRKGYRVTPELPIIKPRSFQPPNSFSSCDNMTARNLALQGGSQPEHRTTKSWDIVVNDGYPDPELAPFNEISKVYRDKATSARIKQLMCLRDQGGLPLLKEATALFLNETRGLNIRKDDLVITRGAQMAIYIAATVLLAKGDHVVVTEPNYRYADEIIENTGAHISKIGIDAEGPALDQLEQILKKSPVKMLYIVPHLHHPTTITMSAERRQQLLQLIERYRFYVIEDDYGYDFHYTNNPILPLASSPHGGKIIYIGSFTKLLAPSIRVGYMIAAPDIVKKATDLKRLIDLRGDTFIEFMLAQMIINGDLVRHINRSNKLYARRCDFICDLLTKKLSHAVEFTRPLGGMAIWLRFKRQYPVNKIINDAAHAGLCMIGMPFRLAGNPNDNGIRFGFASLSEEEISKAVDILVKLTSCS